MPRLPRFAVQYGGLSAHQNQPGKALQCMPSDLKRPPEDQQNATTEPVKKNRLFWPNSTTPAAATVNIVSSKTNTSAPATQHTPNQPVSTSVIPNDLVQIKSVFGTFKVFNQAVSANAFIDSLEDYLTKSYGKCEPIIEFFYKLVDETLFSWFFNLSSQVMSDWRAFANSFINEVDRIEFLYFGLCHLNRKDFLSKLQSIKTDSKFEESAKNSPLTTYFREKTKCYRLVYPKMSDTDVVLNTLTQIGDADQFKKYRKMANDLKALVFVLKHDDCKARK